VVPFEITLPADAGFYLVSPEARADTPRLSAFRHWLNASIHGKPEQLRKPEPLAEAKQPARRRRV
jgi:LysR family glycine cleavage system transcriptional activator